VTEDLSDLPTELMFLNEVYAAMPLKIEPNGGQGRRLKPIINVIELC